MSMSSRIILVLCMVLTVLVAGELERALTSGGPESYALALSRLQVDPVYDPQAAPERPVDSPVAASAPKARTYLVRRGDALSNIARELYGSAALWPRILEANRDQLARPEALHEGMVLKIPPSGAR